MSIARRIAKSLSVRQTKIENNRLVQAVVNNRVLSFLSRKRMNKLVRVLNEMRNKMRLTTEQRLVALERDSVVLHDTIKLLHKLLKEQRQLISEYITQTMMSSNEGEQKENVCPADALYTFKCKRRFEDIEKHIEKMHKLMEEPKRGLKAG